MTDRELMQQALDVLEFNQARWQGKDEVVTALRKRLKQPKQEPVTHTTGHCENHKQKGGCQLHNLQCGWPDCDRKPITTQPKMQPCAGRNCGSTNPNLHSAECFEDYEKSTGMSQWHGLTDGEIDALAMDEDGLPNSHIELARAIEAKLKEKNT